MVNHQDCIARIPGEPVLYPTTFGYTDPDGGGWKANNGNRRQMVRNGSTTNLSYTNNSNRLTNDGSQSLTYDAAGNQIGNGTDSWVYDPRGLIKQYRQNGSTVAAYTYDYRSLRSKKALTGAQTTVYLYDLQGQLIAEYDNGSLRREYVWLDGAPLAQIDTGESITWFTTDHLFTPRLGTDSSKEPVWQWDSYAFGETDPFPPTGSSGTMPTVNLRFPGQYFDSESGGYYNWHRYYKASIGRYTQSDPIGLQGGLNTYAYVGDNPLIYTDPLGLRASYCQRPLGDYSGQNGGGPPLFNHQFICVTLADGTVRCDSNNNPDNDTNPLTPAQGVPSKPDRDNESVAQCDNIDDDRSYN